MPALIGTFMTSAVLVVELVLRMMAFAAQVSFTRWLHSAPCSTRAIGGSIRPSRALSLKEDGPRHGVIEQARSRCLHVRDDELRGRGRPVCAWSRPPIWKWRIRCLGFTTHMTERLAFGCGMAGPRREDAAAGIGASCVAGHLECRRPMPLAQFVSRAERRLGVHGPPRVHRPAVLPSQEQIPLLNPLHLAEISAVLALAAMVMGRMGRGLSITRYTPSWEGAAAGIHNPRDRSLSIWPGGAIATFTEIYSKIILIFILMLNTLTNPKRIDRFLWLIVFIAAISPCGPSGTMRGESIWSRTGGYRGRSAECSRTPTISRSTWLPSCRWRRRSPCEAGR